MSMPKDEREQARQRKVAQNNATVEWDRAWRQRMRELNACLRARERARPGEQLPPVPPPAEPS